MGGGNDDGYEIKKEETDSWEKGVGFDMSLAARFGGENVKAGAYVSLDYSHT